VEFDRKLMAVISPWEPSDRVAEAYMLRGAILASFAHIEQCLSELAIRASYAPEYDSIASDHDSLPFTMSKRVRFLKRIAGTAGPLGPYSSLLQSVLKRWEKTKDLRDQMAHAHMSVLPNAPVRFSGIKPDGGEIHMVWSNYFSPALTNAALRAARFSRACQRIRDKFEAQQLLPTFEDARIHHEGR